MIENYPEIIEFFEKESFTEDELVLLKSTISNKYHSTKDRELAESLIELKLIQFQLHDYSPPKNKTRQNKVIRLHKKSKKSSKSTAKREDKLGRPKVKIDYSYIKDLTIEEISIKLDVSMGLIIRYLQKNQIAFTKESKIDEEIFKSERMFFNNFYKALLRKNRKENPKPKLKSITKKKGSRKSTAPGVYGRIQKAGGVGKLIYIRKK